MNRKRKNDSVCAALYVRLSREDEGESVSRSIQNQKEFLIRKAQEIGISRYRVFSDDGFSGGNYDRPAFRQMLSAIEAGEVNMVMTKDLSRLGRDYIQTGYYLEHYFPLKRVRYLSVLDGIDTEKDDTSNDMTPFRALMNDMYARDISRKIRSIKRSKQLQGKFIGAKALYGYRKDPLNPGHLVVDEEAANIVKKIYQWARMGLSCPEISRKLNEQGTVPPSVYAGLRGYALWSSGRIYEMLRNSSYIGNMVQAKRERLSYKSSSCIARDPSQWIVIPGTHEALIDERTFAEVQQLLDQRRKTRSGTLWNPFRTLSVCGECGRPLSVVKRMSKSGEVQYLLCRRHKGAPSIRSDRLQDMVRMVFEKNLSKTARRILPALLEDERMGCSHHQLYGNPDRLNARIDVLYRDRAQGLLKEEDFVRIYHDLCVQRDKIQERIIPLEEKRITFTEQMLEGFITSLLSDSRFLVQWIQKIEVDREAVRLVLRCAQEE